MKQRYTLTIADVELNVISDGSAETVEALVNNVDRKMREVLLANRRCSKVEAALLCALSYCADKTEAARKQTQLENLVDEKELEIRTLKKEAEEKSQEIERLQQELAALQETRRGDGATAAKSPAEEEAPAVVDPDQVTLSEVEEEVTSEDPAETPAEASPKSDPFDPFDSVEPEDIDFDPVETFRMMKSRGQKKKKR